MFGILLLVLINLGTGYALAVCRYRPDLLPIPWQYFPARWTPQLATPAGADSGSSSIAAALVAAEPLPTKIEQPFVGDVADQPVSQTPQSALPQATRKPVAEPAIEELLPNSSTVPAEQLEETPAVPDGSQVDADSQRDAVEDAVMAFKAQLTQYCSEMGVLDQQMRAESTAPQLEHVKSCVAQYEELSARFLQQHEQSVAALREQFAGATAELAKPCLAAADQHTAAMHAGTKEILSVAGLADAAAACRAFLLTTDRLAKASDVLHQEIDHTLDHIVQSDHTPSPDSNARKKSSTETLEGAISEFIQNNSKPEGKYSVALVQLDQANGINKRQGRSVTDRIVDAVSRMFVALSPHSTLAHETEQQQFLYFQADASARETTDGVEQVRLRIEAATFKYDSKPIRVTLSCSVAEAKYDEPPAPIVARLKEMLREAQRYGKNRTFFQEGEQSAPAIPPNIAIDARMIEV